MYYLIFKKNTLTKMWREDHLRLDCSFAEGCRVDFGGYDRSEDSQEKIYQVL